MKRKPLLAALPLSLFLLLSSCGESSGSGDPKIVIREKELLATPTISLNANGEIECSAIEHAESYILESLNEATNKTKRIDVASFPYALTFEEGGVYSVRVAALPAEDSIYSQSLFSDYLQMVSSVKTKLSSPKNLKVVNNKKITFERVANASRYQITVDENTFETKENSYSYDFLPGTTYKIKVKALIDENIFLLSSDWSSELSFKYTVKFTQPTGLSLSSLGELSWSCSSYSAATGFTVKAVNQSSKAETLITTLKKRAQLASLPAGSYDVSVMANPVGENPGSAYSSTKSIKVEVADSWDAQSIASFAGFNTASGKYLESEGVASMRCKEGWGGLLTPGSTVDFSKSPVLYVNYKEVLYGYMGYYFFDGPTGNPTAPFQGDVYVESKTSDVELAYDMTKNAWGKSLDQATGKVNNFSAMIGFCNASSVSNSDREVAKVKSAQIVYLTIL